MWWMWYIVVTSTGPLQVMQRVRVLNEIRFEGLHGGVTIL